MAGGVEFAELPADVTLNGVKLVQFLLGVEGQGARVVIIHGHRRQFAAAAAKKRPLDVVVPFDGVEDANRPLRLDEAVAEGANHALIV